MRVTIFNGSPRGGAGNTGAITGAFLRGAAKAGAETEEVSLIEKEIEHCAGCFHCWFKTPGRCVRRDDMDELLALYKRSDIVGFATPVFTWNMTAALKNFVDRLVPLKSPLLTQRDGNFDLEDTEKKDAIFVAIANAGFPGANNFHTIREVFAPCNPVLEIYRNCGRLLSSKDAKIRDIVAPYLQSVEDAGFEVASTGRASDETARKLERELLPVQEYVKFLGM